VSKVAAPPNKALQLTWHSEFQSILVGFWHQLCVPQRPSAACATQLSARSVGRRGGTRAMTGSTSD
jgi:hypothetical protein